MIRSVRFEASGDEPGQVKDIFDAAFRRLGLPPGEIDDEHYERTASGGYTGRVKASWDVPMNAREEERWWAETAEQGQTTWARLVKDGVAAVDYYTIEPMPRSYDLGQGSDPPSGRGV